MKSKFKKLMAAALVLCLMLALLPAGVLAEGTYTITIKNEAGDTPVHGTVTAAGADGQTAESFNEKDVVTLTASPESNYKLYSIRIEDANGQEINYDISDGKYVFTMPASNVTVTAAFKLIYTVSAETGLSGGNVKVDQTTASVQERVNVTVTADADYEISEVWYKDSSGSQTACSKDDTGYYFIMPASDVTVGATFTELSVEYTVACTVNGAGGSISTDQNKYAEGANVQVNVVAEDGYYLKSLTMAKADGSDPAQLGGDYSFTMPSHDVKLTAEFGLISTPTTYTVSTSSSVGGSVTATPSTGLKLNDTVTVYVQPNDGYYLKSLYVGGEDVTNKVTWDWYWNWYYSRTGTYSFQMPANDVKVVATFATWYDGDIACIYDGRFGNVTLNVWSKTLDKFVPYTTASKGDLVQVIVEPYNGYAMNSLSISERDYWGSSVDYWQSWKHDNVYYFYMPESDVNLYVDFTEAVSEHIVYVDKAANGSLKADTTWAADGQIVYVTATPDTGYVLSSLFVKTAKGDQLKVYEAKKAGVYYFYMPDQYVTVSAYFAPAASALPFNDVAYTSWYYDAVKFVYDKGIMDGVSYYKFAPDATITRGMVVTMLWRMAGEPYEAAAGFTDVAAGRYYTTAVAWAARNGIVEGMTATTFAPDQAITREQLASILYRYAKWLGFSGYGSDISGYTDAGKVSSYAYDAMSWAVRSGVVTGTSARVLDPQGTASRAAAAQMFMNFYNYIK